MIDSKGDEKDGPDDGGGPHEITYRDDKYGALILNCGIEDVLHVMTIKSTIPL